MMTPYQRRVIRQTMLWVNGKPEHNTEDGECCPDFSCCMPRLYEQSQPARIRYFTELMMRYQKPALVRGSVKGGKPKTTPKR